VLDMQKENREDIKKRIERNGLICDCGEKIYEVGKGPIEKQANTTNILIILNALDARKPIIYNLHSG
jgi:hypothetical protein